MQKKIIVATMLSVIVILLSLGIISNLSIHDSIKQSIQERSELAGMLSNYTDRVLQSNLTRLYDISLSGTIDLKDGDWRPEANALKMAYQYSIFTDGIFIVDMKGDIVYTYPAGQMKKRNLLNIPYVRQTLEEQKAVISSIYTEEATNRKVIYVLVPLRNKVGRVVGAAGGEINPTNYILNNIINAIPRSDETIIELVDQYGVVIASNNPVRIFACSDRNKVLGRLIAAGKSDVMKCHRCHEGDRRPAENPRKTTDMLAFAPLTEAPWGISVREPEEKVFAPSSGLKRKFLILGLISTGTAFLLALGMSKSIVNPIKSLIGATRRIGDGNLKEPVKPVSRDEIGTLSESFETMRQRLAESAEKFQRYNAELERRVLERTKELQISRKRLSTLLHEVISAQEDERKRIARELHDETSQAMAALGMSIDIAAMSFKDDELTLDDIYGLRDRVSQLLEGISRLIKDMRPPVLDDLGLESAVRWLAERHLADRGIRYNLQTSDSFHSLLTDEETALDEKMLLMLFRIIQETIINISKHAEASFVTIQLQYDSPRVRVKIADDGVGFDVHEVMKDGDMGVNVGYGILGLRERISLLDGILDISSNPGEGTKVKMEIPLRSLVVQNV
jgi:signal transduction histidine kinase